jgi:hypothetical protein
LCHYLPISRTTIEIESGSGVRGHQQQALE